jgi:LPPG:FO 2-phospho-L-lactate transferase
VAPVVLLAGGTGGAKLARGLLDELGSDLVVIANTGDDVEVYGAHVSPDPDLVTFWLADRIDARGWGLDGDTFEAMGQLRALRLAAGARLTEAIDDLRRAFGVPARVLVPSDEPVRTWIKAGGRWRPFQEFMIRAQAKGPIEDLEYRGLPARPAAEAVAALREADAIIIGPSNPVLSIDPILAVLGDEVRAAPAPVVAVSPLVRGQVLKGPTADCLRWAGRTLDSDGIVEHYGGVIDALVADQRAEHMPTLETDVGLSDPAARRRVAQEVLAFAAAFR